MRLKWGPGEKQAVPADVPAGTGYFLIIQRVTCYGIWWFVTSIQRYQQAVHILPTYFPSILSSLCLVLPSALFLRSFLIHILHIFPVSVCILCNLNY
jgi:hypothetical protein